ncbi:MAG: hypothetical protein R3F11_10740 [Verrucomicrobiales bacterium]
MDFVALKYVCRGADNSLIASQRAGGGDKGAALWRDADLVEEKRDPLPRRALCPPRRRAFRWAANQSRLARPSELPECLGEVFDRF